MSAKVIDALMIIRKLSSIFTVNIDVLQETLFFATYFMVCESSFHCFSFVQELQ